MKKAICAFIAMMIIISPAMASDQYNREYEIINGDTYYYNQTAYICGAYGATGGFEIIENCTIMVSGKKIAGYETITINGEKADIKYASSPYYKGMAWNNFPKYGEQSNTAYYYSPYF